MTVVINVSSIQTMKHAPFNQSKIDMMTHCRLVVGEALTKVVGMVPGQEAVAGSVAEIMSSMITKSKEAREIYLEAMEQLRLKDFKDQIRPTTRHGEEGECYRTSLVRRRCCKNHTPKTSHKWNRKK